MPTARAVSMTITVHLGCAELLALMQQEDVPQYLTARGLRLDAQGSEGSRVNDPATKAIIFRQVISQGETHQTL